jgi:hypothetical protein
VQLGSIVHSSSCGLGSGHVKRINSLDFNDSTILRRLGGCLANESSRKNSRNVKIRGAWLSFIHSAIKSINVRTFIRFVGGPGYYPSLTLRINQRSVFKPVAAHRSTKLHPLSVELLAVRDEFTHGRFGWLLRFRRLWLAKGQTDYKDYSRAGKQPA